MTHLEEEFDEAARTLVGSYRVVRRLAGRAIMEQYALQRRLEAVREVIDNVRMYGGDLSLFIADLEEALDDQRPVV